jgi:Protein of unknown function DUF262
MVPDENDDDEHEGGPDPRFAPEEIAAAEAQIVEQAKRIDFYITEYSVELLANKMRDGEFVVPEYQRAFTWENERKSRFLESLLMSLPIPFLFFWESPDTGKLEIVDGSQRLRTIEQFIHGGFALGELQSLSRLSHFRFADLPASRQRKVKNRSIRGIVLNEHADEEARFDLFERINTGSKAANKAEVRRGALGGPFLDLVIELSKDPIFAKLAPIPEKSLLLRKNEELVTRFFAYGDGLDGYQDRVSPFVYAYTKRKNAEFADNPALIETYRTRFHVTMKFVKNNFPYGFKRNPKGTDTPTARFEAIAVGSYLAFTDNPKIHDQDLNVADWIGTKEFLAVARSDSANVIRKLRGRLEFVRKKLLGK